MASYELEDRSGNFILGVDSTVALERVMRFMRANDDTADEKLIVWARDEEGEPYPLDPTTI